MAGLSVAKVVRRNAPVTPPAPYCAQAELPGNGALRRTAAPPLQAHPTRAKWVFVPAHAIGRTIGDRLVLEGTDWANLRFVTPLDIALRMGAPFLVERGIDPSEEGLGPALDHAPAARPARRARLLPPARQSARPGARAVVHDPRAAHGRRAGGGSRADAFESARQARRARGAPRGVRDVPDDESRGDRATVFQEALQHPDWCPIQPPDCWIELPDVVWSPLERRLFDAMPGERIDAEIVRAAGRRRIRVDFRAAHRRAPRNLRTRSRS